MCKSIFRKETRVEEKKQNENDRVGDKKRMIDRAVVCEFQIVLWDLSASSRNFLFIDTHLLELVTFTLNTLLFNIVPSFHSRNPY